MERLEQKLDALATMSPAQVASSWKHVFRSAPPAVGQRLLVLALAYRLQEQALGGLTGRHARELARLRARYERTGEVDAESTASLKVGTRLVRAWGGEAHHVLICDSGYQYRDRTWSSLTQIARAITGTNWSGPRFFGLTPRRKANSGRSTDA